MEPREAARAVAAACMPRFAAFRAAARVGVRRCAAAACACALASCAAPPRSVTLSLSLRPGMERTMRFVTTQKVDAAARRSGAAGSTTISLTYAFRVVTVEASGLATIESTLRDASVPGADRGTARAVEAMKRERVVVTLDRNGRVMRMQSDGPGNFQIPGLPSEPGTEMAREPAQGELAQLFSGYNGRTVTVGETWTTAMPRSPGAPGARGTLRWTLASVTDASARLSYAGSIETGVTAVPGSADGTEIAGTVSGYVSLERATGWPERGASVIRARVTLRGADGPATGGARERRALSLNVTNVFDEVP